jgi:hypothetical protein
LFQPVWNQQWRNQQWRQTNPTPRTFGSPF